jgi:hypothetical protein
VTGPPETDLLGAWRVAEAALGHDTPPPALPPALLAVWRAMDALDRGLAANLRALADELGAAYPDVAATLRLVLAAPGGDLAHDDVPETIELPYRDVLALLDVGRTGVPAVPSARLETASRYRPVLHAFVRLCTDGRTDLYTNPIVAAFSPRADQLQAATRAVQITGCTARARLGDRLTPDGLVLAPDRWPDIDLPLVDGDLAVWSTTRIPWTDGDDDAVQALLTQPEVDRRHALGLLLHRLQRDLPLGRLTGMVRPARAALRLAHSLDGPSELVTQLGVLQLRIERYDPDHPVRPATLFVHLWRDRARLRPEERVVVARALLDQARDHAEPADLHDAALILIAQTPSSDEAGEAALDLTMRWPPDVLLSGLARYEAAVLRKVHIAGLHAASAGFFTQALAATRRLATEPAPDEAAVGQLIQAIVSALAHQRDQSDRVAAGLRDLAPARLPLAVWGPALLDPDLRARIGDAALAMLREIPTREQHPADRATRLVLDGDPRHAIRQLGRTLRGLSPPLAARLALRTLASLYAWNPTQARALRLAPLTAWLLHDPTTLLVARDELPRRGPLVVGAVDWWLHVGQDQVDDEAWRDRLRVLLQAPPAYAAALTEAARTTSLRDARRVPDAVATLQHSVSARLALLDNRTPPVEPAWPLRPPALDRASAPIYVAADGTVVPDSHVLLGLNHEVTDPERVREAFRVAILARPPERDPRGAEQLREARDRLTLPDRLLDRELGVLYVPEPEAWGLPSPLPEQPGVLRPEARLLGQLALYCLVEEALWTIGLGARFAATIEALRAQQSALRG